MNKRAREIRFTWLKAMPCITCPGCGVTEIHHLNLGGHAGQKRLGDEFTIPLGSWAHRGVLLHGMTHKRMRETFGPSLANGSKPFHARFGNDQELLAETNRLIGDKT